MVGTEFVHWNRTPQIMSPRKQHSAWCLAPSRCSVLSVCGLEILKCRWLLSYGLVGRQETGWEKGYGAGCEHLCRPTQPGE